MIRGLIFRAGNCPKIVLSLIHNISVARTLNAKGKNMKRHVIVLIVSLALLTVFIAGCDTGTGGGGG
jgi:predicted small secreted protein